MFRGLTNLNLDTKGRIAMPARYRDRLMAACEGHLVITVDPDGCLLVYPQPAWEQIEQAIMSRPNMDRQVRRLQRIFVGHATECELDAQGRILLPPPLRAYARLDKRAVLIGQGNKFELWDEDTWMRQRDFLFQDDGVAGDLSAALTNLSV